MHQYSLLKKLPVPRFSSIMIYPGFTAVIVCRAKYFHLDRPLRPGAFIADEVDIETLKHCFVIVASVILGFPSMVLSGIRSIQENAETLRRSDEVSDAKPPLQSRKYAPPAGSAREHEDEGNGKANGDVHDSEISQSNSPFFVTIADCPADKVWVRLVT